MQYPIHKKIMRNRILRITHFLGPAHEFQIPNPDRGSIVLMEKELKDDQYHKEPPGQHPDLPKVVFNVSVIGVELRCARRWHEGRGFTHLSSVFLGHKPSPF
jgi:hypothetical protein